MHINSYRDLLAWQKGIELTEAIYRVSKRFPPEELYGLTNQVRRAAMSVPSNIAEGAGRNTSGEFAQSIGHSRGSLFEVETQLIVAERVSYLSQSELRPLFNLTDEIGRLTAGLIRSLSGQRIG
jgi:four helix bundle protein